MFVNRLRRFDEVRQPLKVLTVCLASSVTLLFVINPVWGFYDSFMALLASGSIGGLHIEESYHLGLRGLAKTLKLLHIAAPSAPWTAILMFSGWIYIQTVTMLVILSINRLQQPSWKILFIHWLIIQALIWGYSFTEFSITCMGLLLTYTATISIQFVIEKRLAITLKIFAYTLAVLMIIMGFGLRLESGYGGILFAGIFTCCYLRNFYAWLQVMWLPLAVSLGAFYNYNSAVKQSDFFKNVEPIIFYVTDSKNKPHYDATDEKDSIKIEMALSSCLIDSSTINYVFYSQLADYKRNLLKKTIYSPVEVFNQIKKVITPTIANNKMITVTAIMLMFFSLFATWRMRTKIHFVMQVLFNVAVICIIFILAYTMKMEQWHYIPIIQILMISNFFFASTGLVAFFSKSKLTISALLLLWLFLLSCHAIDVWQNRLSINEKIREQKKLESRYRDAALFYDVNTRELLDDYAFSSFMPKNNIYFYDLAQLPYLKEYAERLSTLCDCNPFSPVEFFRFLKNDKVIYISTEERVDMIKRYMKIIHQTEVTFTTIGETELLHVKHPQSVSKFNTYIID